MTAEDFLGFLEAETRRIGFESRAHSGVQHLLGGLRSHPVMEIVPNKARSLSLSLSDSQAQARRGRSGRARASKLRFRVRYVCLLL